MVTLGREGHRKGVAEGEWARLKLPHTSLGPPAWSRPGARPGRAEMEAGRCPNPARKRRPGTRCSSRFPRATNRLVRPEANGFRAEWWSRQPRTGARACSSGSLWGLGQAPARTHALPGEGRPAAPEGGPASPRQQWCFPLGVDYPCHWAACRDEQREEAASISRPAGYFPQVVGRVCPTVVGQWSNSFTPWRPRVASVSSSLNWRQ